MQKISKNLKKKNPGIYQKVRNQEKKLTFTDIHSKEKPNEKGRQ